MLSLLATRSIHMPVLILSARNQMPWTTQEWSQARAPPFSTAFCAPTLSEKTTTLQPLSSFSKTDKPDKCKKHALSFKTCPQRQRTDTKGYGCQLKRHDLSVASWGEGLHEL